jgi:thiamine biosynthesis protein ThiC
MSELKTYVIRRRDAWKTPEELQAAGAKSGDVGDNEMSADIRWIRSYAVAESDGSIGTVCIYRAVAKARARLAAAVTAAVRVCTS